MTAQSLPRRILAVSLVLGLFLVPNSSDPTEAKLDLAGPQPGGDGFEKCDHP